MLLRKYYPPVLATAIAVGVYYGTTPYRMTVNAQIVLWLTLCTLVYIAFALVDVALDR